MRVFKNHLLTKISKPKYTRQESQLNRVNPVFAAFNFVNSSGFGFNSQNNQPNSQQPQQNALGFGGNSAPATNAFGFGATSTTQPATAPIPGAFSLGGASSAAPEKSTSATSGFNIGNNTTTTTTSTPAFGGSGFTLGGSAGGATGGNLFGGSTTQPGGLGLFGAKPTATTAASISGGSVSGFGFGAATTQPGSTGSFGFGGAATQPGTTGFGSATTQPGSTGSFGFGGATMSTKPAETTGGLGFGSVATTKSTGPVGGFGFGGTSATTQSTTAGIGGLGFGVAPSTQPSQPSGIFVNNSKVSTSTAPNLSGFGGLNVSKPAQPTSNAPNLFGGNLLSNTTTSASLVPVTPGPLKISDLSNTPAPTIKPATGLGGFSGLGIGATSTPAITSTLSTKPNTSLFSPTTTATTTTAIANPILSTTPATIPTVGSSSTQPNLSTPNLVAGIASLKNKTMEDILNKWTGDLDMYSKEFHRVAVQVAQWDEVLVRNGDQISDLNNELQETEKIQKAIEQNLEYVEGQQTELDNLLTSFESQLRDV
ncbi:FG-nucleoporin nsp1, partial [Nowakowskiella sp. JEL0078]